MIYGSVCSGIEAATVAWDPLGWRPAFFAEIDKFPSAVLKHHYPEVQNHGDFTTIQAGDYAAIDLLVGGTPCQSFSIAGLRGGMDDARGQLALEFLRLADRLRPRWLVWENVPGVLSSNGGRDFGSFLGGLGELGYGFAYRVLDAQHFGVPQRRRRVFVVGHLGDWRRAAAVLFERHSLSGHPPPRREAGQGATYDVAPCLGASGRGFERTGDTRGQDCLVASTGEWPADVAQTLDCHYGDKMGLEDQHINGGASLFVPVGGFPDTAHSLRADGFDASEDGTGRGTPLVPMAMNLRGRDGGAMPELDEVASIRAASGGSSRSYLATTMAVRRLTPRECERLQGFPDDYTKLSDKTADGPRYKALGNSMAVPVMSWIGERIQQVEEL